MLLGNGNTSGNNYIFKELFGSVVRPLMIDDEIGKLIWEVMVLERRFEDDPYSLALEEAKVLSDTEQHRPR